MQKRKKLLILTVVFALLLALLVSGCTFTFPNKNTAVKENYVVMTSSSAEGEESRDLETVIASLQPKVAEIYTTVADGTSAGSGVIIGKKNDADGAQIGSIIVTNHHVIEGGTRIIVKLCDGTSYDAKFIGSDPDTDIAVLSAEFTGIEPAEWFENSDTIKVGSTAIAIGNALGSLGGTVTKGIVSAVARTINVEGQTMEVLQTDASINGGNSGGGLFNPAGKLIGIVNAKAKDFGVEGLGFAIPANTARNISTELMESAGRNGHDNGYIEGRYRLGFTLGYTKNIFGQVVGLGILEIDTNGAAYKAGVRKNDTIQSVSVNGTTETEIDKMIALLGDKTYPLGQTIVMECVVSGSTAKISRTLTLVQYEYKLPAA